MTAVEDHAWPPGPNRPLLVRGAVHVWHADLATGAENLGGLLSREERVRAERFPRHSDGQLWARSRGVLRALLARYLDLDPRALRFAEGRHGKPWLLPPPSPSEGPTAAHSRTFFNLSHSGRIAVYALTRTGPVGVDVEVARRPWDPLAVTARAFGREEAARLVPLSRPTRERAFLQGWVRHEAKLKCLGVGIGGKTARAHARRLWSSPLEMGSVATGAVALTKVPGELRCWGWRSDPPAGTEDDPGAG